MDFYKLNFPSGSFDGFWASASLLHIPKNKIHQVLSDIKNIIKPNGIGFISLKQKTHLGAGLITEDKYGTTMKTCYNNIYARASGRTTRWSYHTVSRRN